MSSHIVVYSKNGRMSFSRVSAVLLTWPFGCVESYSLKSVLAIARYFLVRDIPSVFGLPHTPAVVIVAEHKLPQMFISSSRTKKCLRNRY